MKSHVLSLIAAAIFLTAVCPGIPAPAAYASETADVYADLAQYQVGSVTLEDDGAIHIPVKISTYAAGETTEATQVVTYVMNHAMPRAGREADTPILTDFLEHGYIVVILDYLSNPLAVSPAIDWSILGLRTEMNKGGYLYSMKYRKDYNHIVPAGCRMKSDILYFSYDKHASKGTMEKIVSVWNDTVVPLFGEQYGLKEAETIKDCVKPDGSPIDLNLRMDIVYPSQPDHAVPLFMMAASSENRVKSTLTTNRPHFIGLLMRGYAAANYDHEYIPMARDDHYGYFQPYGLQGWNGVKTQTAAVRCARVYADELGYDKEKIGVFGHSKSSYCAILADPHPELLKEGQTFAGFPDETYGEQPWLTYEDGSAVSSQVQAAYSSMGDGLARYSSFVNSETSPTLLACGNLDQYGSWDKWPGITAKYAKAGIPYLAMSMIGIGHDYPYGYDNELGYDRYTTFFDFFDYYLKADTAAPQLVYSSPKDGPLDIGAEETSQFTLKFIGSIPEAEIQGKAAVTHSADGTPVSGSWASASGGTEWSFSSNEFIAGEAYTVTVPDTITDSRGAALRNSLTKEYDIISSNKLYNVAKNKEVSSSQATWIDAYKRLPELVDGITEGRTTSRWVNDNNYAATNPIPMWVEIDLGSSFTLYFADLFTGTDNVSNVAEQIVDYRLEYCDPQGAWQPIPGTTITGNTLNYNFLKFDTPVTSSKIRLYSADDVNKFVVLKEIRLFGLRPDSGDAHSNIAAGKKVTAGAASESSVPANVVDGINNQTGMTYVWFISQFLTVDKAWLEIDLGKPHVISSSIIYTGYGDGNNRCTSYHLQYWKDGAWVDIPGGTELNNTAQKSALTFDAPVITDKVRFAANVNLFRIQEIEIYGAPCSEADEGADYGTEWLEANGTLHCCKVVKNTSAEPKTLMLVLAQYLNQDELEQITVTKEVFEPNARKALTAELETPRDAGSGTIRAFIWEADTISPVTVSEEY